MIGCGTGEIRVVGKIGALASFRGSSCETPSGEIHPKGMPMNHTVLILTAALLLPLAACSPSTSPPTPSRTTAVQASKPTGQTVNLASDAMNKSNTSPAEKVQLTDTQWEARLTPEQYRVLRQKGTERAFSGKYWNSKDKGVYKCAGCGEVLFTSDAKFDSGCGWPSFNKPADGITGAGEGKPAKVVEHVDTSFGMKRVEVLCAKCGGHLGHVFDDAPDQPGGLRYCINSASIDLNSDGQPKDDQAKPDAPKEDARK